MQLCGKEKEGAEGHGKKNKEKEIASPPHDPDAIQLRAVNQLGHICMQALAIHANLQKPNLSISETKCITVIVVLLPCWFPLLSVVPPSHDQIQRRFAPK